ncbi:helix-turn-helix transcriptional regulator [Chakrabartyella piscis]|uniref:helix-turn-helix domain-containing protein n=1 Tax=Chakrabartyella piscis TaxID=2918914 RepID=UPI0029583C17|nr:helix-turn-helix transcriptional regulator [Chakrabartyella piscis]
MKLRQDIHIGVNLRNLRKNSKLTQEQVVARLQLKESTTTRSIYSRYETGELNIKISDLVILKELFNCSFDDFFVDL